MSNDEAVTSRYPPVPLAGRGYETRLLTLHPGNFGDQLHGTLRTVSLDGRHPSEALSYTWGKSTLNPLPTIILNGRYGLVVTENLYGALQRLRHRVWSRSLWIDAICINQTDTDERNRQVSIMGAIYKSARRVCIWLGDTYDVPAPVILQTLPLSGPTYRISVRRRQTEPILHGRVVNAREKLLASSYLHPRQTTAAAIFNTSPPWHTRAWVYQELNNARKLVWCFGPIERSDDVQTFAKFIKSPRPRGLVTGPHNLALTDLGSLLDDTSSSTWQDSAVGFKHTALLQNAAYTTKMRATNPRDKVFSLRGVTRAEEAHRLSPDYDKTIAQVFAEAAFASIVGSQNFDALFYAIGFFDSAHRNSDTEDRLMRFPTWAIDFDADYLPPPPVLFGTAISGLGTTNGIMRQSSQPRLSPCMTQLHLHVMLLSEVSAAVPRMIMEGLQPEESIATRQREVQSVHAGSEQTSIKSARVIDGEIEKCHDKFELPTANEGEHMDQHTTSIIGNGTTTNVSEDIQAWFTEVFSFLSGRESMEHAVPGVHGSASALRTMCNYLKYRGRRSICTFTTASGLLGFGNAHNAVGEIAAFL